MCVCGERVDVKEPESYLKVVSVTLPSVLSLIRTPLHMNDPPPHPLTHHECTMHWRSLSLSSFSVSHSLCTDRQDANALTENMIHYGCHRCRVKLHTEKPRISCKTVYCVTQIRLGNDVMTLLI